MKLLLTSAALAITLMLPACGPCRTSADASVRLSSRARFLSFLPRHDDESLPHLLVSLEGNSFPAVMDTGSTGLVVSADRVPNAATLPVLGPAQLTYSSSGRIMVGDWVLMPISIGGGNGNTVTTVPMPVLLVRSENCLPGKPRCHPSLQPHGIAMLGIGFGREGDHQAQSTPDRNPFLGVPQTRRHGYIVTASGVLVGLPPSADIDGLPFETVQLQRNPTGTDWQGAPVCITIDRGVPACGRVLMDTGVTEMFLTVPQGSLPFVGHLTDRSRIHLNLTGRSDSDPEGIAYDVALGASDSPLAPSAVRLVGIGRRPTFVNTGVHFLRQFDLLFDADAGLVGYRRGT